MPGRNSSVRSFPLERGFFSIGLTLGWRLVPRAGLANRRKFPGPGYTPRPDKVPHYAKVLIVGHSLGSLLAYDGYRLYRPKGFKWVNMWSPEDIISGELNYYDGRFSGGRTTA